jgi:AraC-like DNA-binding protein
MATYHPTALARIPIRLLDQAALMGVDRRRLMTEAGMSLQELKDPDARVPVGKIWKLWHALIQQVPDTALGLKMAEVTTSPTAFGLVGYTLYYSRTLGQALHRLARYSRIISETIQISVQQQGGRWRVRLESDPQFELLRHPIDSRLGNILSTLRKLSGKPLTPLEVDFPYPKPANAPALRRFFQAPLRFGCRAAALWLRPSDLEIPVTHADPTLVRYLDRLAEEQLKALGTGTLTERVGRTLWSELSSGMPPLRRVADLVGVSPRSLQRHLRDEGKPYRDLLEDFRREMSARLMGQRGLAVYEIAFLLGYTDPSSFHRAFRRWYKTSPRSFRRAS